MSEKIVILVVTSAIGFGVDIVAAQIADFGLSQLHVHAGIWGPFFILSAIATVVTGSVKMTVNRRV